ncbi:MAG: CoA transferase [Oscillospiraceae bacterium]|nr:CoA transferase [Oscillospiraceae bacterium]
MPNTPLKGVKVVDFTVAGAGPAAGKMLADWGADVIKVEPLTGEAGRLTGLTLLLRADEEQNPHADGKDGGKRSLPINMKDPRGVEIMDKLLAESNIFISNYRPKALTKLGLDYEQMSARHPHIIWGCLTGFGLEGPIANNPGYDTVAFWARSGAMIDLCDNGDIPLTPPFALGDYGTACSLAGGCAAALYQQAKTGKGEKVMVSLYGQAIWDNSAIMQAEYHGNMWPKTRFEPDSPLRNTYKCKDGTWTMISILTYERFYAPFMKLLGREDLIDDERFNTEVAMRSHKKEMMEILDPIFLTKDYDEWDKLLNENDIAHDRINHIVDTITDEQAIANGYVYEYANRDGSKELMVSTPIKFGKSEPIPVRWAPLLGEHSVEVMKELGYDEETIKTFAAEGVIKIHD